MSNSENGKIQYEQGQVLVAYEKMTDSGDHKVFSATENIWSGKAGFTPSIRPNGLVSGRNLITVSTVNDEINIAAFTAYSKGVLQSVSAATNSITRTATPGVAQIHSITMASNGSIAIVEGTVSATTAFSETRAAAGGPPLIPVNDDEIGQIRVTTSTAAVIATTEVFQLIGTHTERYDYPGWVENNIGDGAFASASAKENAYIELDSAMPLIHTGPAVKAIHAQYYAPSLVDLGKTVDFVPVEDSHSVSSTQIYGKTIGSRSSSLGQGSFTVLLNDGVTDSFLAEKNQVSTIKFFPDKNKTPYMLTQGKLGIGRTYPVADQNQAAVTVSADNPSSEFLS